ncbi:hypothetical protein L195_g002823 [Trifolium pratense]|uniref:Uncharacterized protein n=1 Tax=Trifolium pratense TaxID=57577 RepID=A0A2K3NTK3_TRIPR|nr:hypothetical protein L195_g002823 [Trifolium pratense]
MASFSVEEFIGNGVLKELLQKLLEEGWDDVPTLKVMGSEDMDLLYMTQKQKIRDGYVFKGIVASEPSEPRACGCVKPPQVSDQVASYGSIENISVQKLTPEYKIGMEPLVKIKTPPFKASELWRDKPAVIFCLRRPG